MGIVWGTVAGETHTGNDFQAPFKRDGVQVHSSLLAAGLQLTPFLGVVQ